MSDPVGQLVEFIDKNRLCLAFVQSAKKTKLNVLTSADKELSLPQGRVLLMTAGGGLAGRNRQALVERLREVEARREGLAQGVDVAGLWELVAEEAEPLLLADLAGLAHSGQLDGDHLSATLRALFNERWHFKMAGEQFAPLSAEQLEQKQLQAQREDARREQVDAAVDYLRGLADKGPYPPAPDGLLDLLADLVVFEDDAPNLKRAKEIVALAELGGRKNLFDLLVRLGRFSPHENLPLLKDGVARAFDHAALAAAAQVDLEPALEDKTRRDLTDMHVFTIDGAFTTDFDDALSFEPEPDGGGVLGVHITDAGAVLAPDSPLDLEARGRGTSIYMPDDRIPMLPPSLSEDALSLRQDQLRPAISTLARLDADGQVLDYEIVRSVIRVARRITYDEADYLLDSDPRLKGMHAICQALKAARGRAGAYFLPLPEVIVGVDELGQVYVRRIDREGASREMVAETAILANWLAARHLRDHDAPCLYRRQSPPVEPFQEGQPEDIYLHFSQRRLLNPADLTTKPGPHSSLGVEPYTQVTSPIRRYFDLIVQRQLGAVLAGRGPVYAKSRLKELAQEVDATVRRAGRARNMRQRYWLLKWLEARKGQELDALVMEPQMRRWSILLTDIMMLTSLPRGGGQPEFKPGQALRVVVEKADAFHEILRVRLA